MEISKYDRQIRLWGAKGQRLLGESKIALLGCSGPGIEAVKNLVLPGVGSVDIWDERKIAVEDLSDSFFYEHSSVGQYRAEVALKNLLEMNPQVSGHFHNVHPSQLLKDESMLKEYKLIISCNLPNSLNKHLSRICEQLDIIVMFIEVLGFSLYVRSQKIIHFVQNEKLTAQKYYLRLRDPFVGLKEYSSRWNVQQMIDNYREETDGAKKSDKLAQLDKIPYPVILMQVSQKLPVDKHTRMQMVNVVKNWQKQIQRYNRQNFIQAIKQVMSYFQTSQNYLNMSIFDNVFVQNADKTSSKLPIFLKACCYYYKQTGSLPQPTVLPDISTTTANYIDLKDVYKEQHRKTVGILRDIIALEFEGFQISQAQLSNYVDNMTALDIINMLPFHKQLECPNVECLQQNSLDMRNLMLSIRATKVFEEMHGRHVNPKDLVQLKDIAKSMMELYRLERIDQRYLVQACRAEGQSVISISSIAGAIAGQQSVKLLTNCFRPMNSGYLYDGMTNMGYSIAL